MPYRYRLLPVWYSLPPKYFPTGRPRVPDAPGCLAPTHGGAATDYNRVWLHKYFQLELRFWYHNSCGQCNLLLFPKMISVWDLLQRSFSAIFAPSWTYTLHSPSGISLRSFCDYWFIYWFSIPFFHWTLYMRLAFMFKSAPSNPFFCSVPPTFVASFTLLSVMVPSAVATLTPANFIYVDTLPTAYLQYTFTEFTHKTSSTIFLRCIIVLIVIRVIKLNTFRDSSLCCLYIGKSI